MDSDRFPSDGRLAGGPVRHKVSAAALERARSLLEAESAPDDAAPADDVFALAYCIDEAERDGYERGLRAIASYLHGRSVGTARHAVDRAEAWLSAARAVDEFIADERALGNINPTKS